MNRKRNTTTARRAYRRITAWLLIAAMAVCFSACGGSPFENNGGTGAEGKKLRIVASTFPEYDWVREILGEETENVELTLLLKNGVDLHSFQPSVFDIMKIAMSDVFVYVGGTSDLWVKDALAEAVNPDMQVINLLEVLGDAVKEEEIVEGMEEEPEEEHGEEEPEYDEHVWLSVKNAQVFVRAIAEVLEKADPARADNYRENAEAYLKKLEDLDDRYQKTVEEGSFDTLLFGDRFPFRYLVDDYGLSYYAAFAGCSAETEASFATIVFLTGKLDELGLPAVLTIEGGSEDIARTIIENSRKKDQKILSLHSMQGITREEQKNGVTYLSIMEKNREVLAEALK